MISGRSLGHTGGTLDKLETIPGFNTQLSFPEMRDVLKQCGAALIGQTPKIVPADRILYALRDHTGTVESPFLITASIMSKKLAEGLNALVLDVKVGSGAFMPTYEKSKLLAELMVETGEASGTRTVALLTTMDEPLGRFSGNWVEVWECVDIMKQQRHPMSADLIELSNILSGWMLHLAGHAATPEEGAKLSDEILRSGAAYKAWLKIVASPERRHLPSSKTPPPTTNPPPPAPSPPQLRLPRRHGLQTSRLGRPTPRRRPRQTRRPRLRPRRHRDARQTRRQTQSRPAPRHPLQPKTRSSSTNPKPCSAKLSKSPRPHPNSSPSSAKSSPKIQSPDTSLLTTKQEKDPETIVPGSYSHPRTEQLVERDHDFVIDAEGLLPVSLLWPSSPVSKSASWTLIADS